LKLRSASRLELGSALATGWLILSLVVSHYVYDRSGIDAENWLLAVTPNPPHSYATLHVGLDEFREILRSKFPDAETWVLDFFDPSEMTEASIRRARRQNGATLASSLSVDFRALPFADAELDAVFLIFSAHELRSETSRQQFFKELDRVLRPSGRMVLVEHLRDAPNFFAFGPGAFHFHSRAAWLRAAEGANLSLAEECQLTPFVRVLLLEKGNHPCSNFLPPIQQAKPAAAA
jgi:SAM-dependent methyltransferase